MAFVICKVCDSKWLQGLGFAISHLAVSTSTKGSLLPKDTNGRILRSVTTKPSPKFSASDIPPQGGRRVLITGANSGIGYEAALELARNGAEVILPARSLQKANDAITRIRRSVPGAKLNPGLLDLASLASVRAFAASIAENFPGQSLDLLINNAGVMAVPQRELTVDGLRAPVRHQLPRSLPAHRPHLSAPEAAAGHADRHCLQRGHESGQNRIRQPPVRAYL